MVRIRQISSKTDLVKYIVLKRRVRNFIIKSIRICIALAIVTLVVFAIYHRVNIRNFIYTTYQTAQTKVSKFYLNNTAGVRIKLQKDSLIAVEDVTSFVLNYTKDKDYRYNAVALINDIKNLYPIIDDVSIRYDISNKITILHIKEKKIFGVLLSNGCEGAIDDAKNKLITENGDNINYTKMVNNDNLLFICGDFHDSQDLLGIKQELIKYKIYDKVKYIKFYTSGRFELMLKNNLLVKMPQKDWKLAMLKFLKMDSEYGLSTGQKHIKYIDLRLGDKVYVKEL